MNEVELKKRIAYNIRILRAKKRISQETLAEKSGTSQQYIAKIETEKVNISTYVLVKIANALNVTANDIIYNEQ